MQHDCVFEAYIERRQLDLSKPPVDRGPIEIPPPLDRAGQIERAYVMAVDETNIVDAEGRRLLVVRNDRGEHVAKWVVVPSSTNNAQAVSYRPTGRLVEWEHTPDGRKHPRSLAFEEMEQLPDFETPNLLETPEAVADVQSHFRNLMSAGTIDRSQVTAAWHLFRHDIQDHALRHLDDHQLTWPISPLCPLARQMLARYLVEERGYAKLYLKSDGQERTRNADRRYDQLRAAGLNEYDAAKALVSGGDVRDTHEAVKSMQDSRRKSVEKRKGLPRQLSVDEQRVLVTEVVSNSLERLHIFARKRLATDILNERLDLWADSKWRLRVAQRARRSTTFELVVSDIADALERDLSATLESSVRDLLDDSCRQLRPDRRKDSAVRR